MKRGKALIIALVLLLVVSVFSTGNYIPFADNLSGGAYSIVGNAIALVTGNMVGVTGNAAKFRANHACTANNDCLSSYCVNGVCDKSIAGEPCEVSRDCFNAYYPNGRDYIGGLCLATNRCKSLGNYVAGNEIREKGQDCKRDADCRAPLTCIGKDPGQSNQFGVCGLKQNQVCRNNGVRREDYCLSAKCTGASNTGKCTLSPIGGLCGVNTDCEDNSFCDFRKKRCTAKFAIGAICAEPYQCPGSNTAPNGNSCYKKEFDNQFGICGLKEGQTCSNGNVCLSKTCTNGKCEKSEASEFCWESTDCTSGNCNIVTVLGVVTSSKCVAPQITTPSIVMQAAPANVPTCTSWKDCTTAQSYCAQNGVCAADRRQITDRDCVGSYQTKIGKGETCKTSMAFSLGNDANLEFFLRNGCTANSQCQLTISGDEIYNYCRKDGFCDARLVADGRGCNTKANLCAIDETCNAATNKCVRVYPDAGEGAAYDSNQHRLKLKKAIENALNMFRTRLNGIEALHQNQAAGAVVTGNAVLLTNGVVCTANNQCTSNICSQVGAIKLCGLPIMYDCQANAACATQYCLKIPPSAQFGKCQKKINGQSCTNNNLCNSGYCNLATNRCAAVPAGGFPDGGGGYDVPRYPDAGAGEAYSGPRTLSEWKAALTSLSTAMQTVEDRICTESSKHLEIETEGLPCSSTSPLAQPAAAIPKPVIPRSPILNRILFRAPIGANP